MEITFFGQEFMAWQFFLGLGILLMVSEIFVPGFVMLPIGLAFIMTSAMTPFTDDLILQFLFLGLNLIFVFFVITKFIKPKFKKTSLKTNAEALVGSEAEVTEAITEGHTGYVKLYGDRWQAYSNQKQSFSVGEKVLIEKLDGNKVIISKR